MSPSAEGKSGWTGNGECVVALARCREGVLAPPPPLRRVPGPVLVVAARYTSSVVGAYLELAIAEPVRLGTRLGTCATVIVVDSAGSREAGLTRWGLPKEMGTLHWSLKGEGVSLRWEERGVTVRAQPLGPRFPAVVPFRSLQVRADAPVRFGGLACGSGRLCRVDVAVEPGDTLACLAGRHPGIHLRQAAVRMGDARSFRRWAADAKVV